MKRNKGFKTKNLVFKSSRVTEIMGACKNRYMDDVQKDCRAQRPGQIYCSA